MITYDYIAGLTDGEGCFYINIRPPRKQNGKPHVEVHFYIKVKADDKSLLEKVKRAIGCGSVYFQNEKRPNHSHCYRYEVNNRQEISAKIIPLFKKHPLQSVKSKDFKLFAKVIKIMGKNKHLTSAGLKKIIEIKKTMSQKRNHRTR